MNDVLPEMWYPKYRWHEILLQIAFLFTFWRLIYREVYRLGVVLFAVNLVFTFTLPLPVTTIAIPLFTGLMGNYLYIQYVNNCYAEAAAMDTVSRDAYAAKHGGTIF